MKQLFILIWLALGVAAFGCGKAASTPTCTETSCEGCCDAQGVCRKGDVGAACGSKGLSCDVCSATQVCSASRCTFAVVTDAGVDGGTDAGALCGPTPVSCSDQVSQGLDLKTTVNAAAILTTTEDGGFKSTIDATAGSTGFNAPTESYVYAKFTSTGLQKVGLSDEAALLSVDWDIAFRRFVIRLNGGSSGPSCVAAAATASGTVYETLAAAPSGATFTFDDFLGPPPTCTFKDDGSGLGTSPSTALAGYYQYVSCVKMSQRVFVVRTRAGRNVKLLVTGYYATEAAQANCNSGASPGAPGGTVRVRWSFLD